MTRAATIVFLISITAAITACAEDGKVSRPETGGGTVERVDYSITYNGDHYDKHAFVYLPEWQEEEDRKYDIFYLMHGGSGRAETFFGGTGQSSII